MLSGKAIVNLQKLVDVGAGLGVHGRLRRPGWSGRPGRPTRSRPQFIKDLVDYGAGPRAGQNLILAGKAMAAMDGRFSVSLDDIRKVAIPVLRHRISTNFQAQAEGQTTESLIKRLLAEIREPEVPKYDRRGGREPTSATSSRALGPTLAIRSRTLEPRPSEEAIALASTAEKYLKPEVIRQVARLDLRAKFIVEGFIAGLHASPFQGFSVEFSEHRKYTAGDNISDIDWNVYAKTDRFYIKKFQAETNLTGYLVMDLSGSMGYTYRQELTKFEYGISLAAALGYLMIHQQDPVGLVAFDQKVRQSLPPKSKRSQLGNILSLLAKLKPAGETDDRQEPAPGRQHDPAPQPGDALQRPAGRPRADLARRCTGSGSPATT